MTTPQQGSGWRRWRRSRPFYGGLLMILSAIELFFSANLNLGALQVHFGPTGFLSYVIPIVMLLCGVLGWVSPGQRLFYGILGALTALYSLIGLNLGGFFAGLLLGVVGGALAAAWSYVPEPAPAETAEENPFDEQYVGQQSTAVYGTPIQAEPVQEAEPRTSGVLTDSLPTSLRSPLHGGPETVEPEVAAAIGGAGDAERERPPVPGGGQHRLRYGGAVFAVLLLAVVGTYVAGNSSPASAAPCGPAATRTMADKSPSASPAVPGANNKAPTGGASSSPGASTSPAPSPSASASQGGNIITDIVGGIVDFWHNLFGGGSKAADPGSASPSPSAPPATGSAPAGPSTQPAPTAPGPSASKSSPTTSRPKSALPCTPTPTGPAKRAALDAGQPAVSSNSSLVLSSTQEMHGLNYDGVVDLPTKNADGTTGSVRVLKFTMTAVSNTPFEMHTPGGPKILETVSDRLTLSGNVEFYTTKLVGKLQLIPGLPPIPLELTFTPKFPPPLTLPDMTFKDVQVDLVYVKADTLTADNFDLHFAA